MKFLADMGISPLSVRFLRALGHDAEHIHELGLDRLSDAEILEKARNEKSIVLTHDLDFGDLLAASGANMPSVVIFRLPDMRPATVNHYLNLLVQNFADALASGVIISVGERRFRTRELPIR